MDERILIVDDEPAVRSVLRRALAAAGYLQTAEADCVEAARRALREEGPFALVLLDIRMPGESGLRLLEELSPMAPQTVVIVVTVSQDVRTAVETMKMGAYDYACKPLDLDELLLTVADALERRRFELRMRRMLKLIDGEIERRLEDAAEARRTL